MASHVEVQVRPGGMGLGFGGREFKKEPDGAPGAAAGDGALSEGAPGEWKRKRRHANAAAMAAAFAALDTAAPKKKTEGAAAPPMELDVEVGAEPEELRVARSVLESVECSLSAGEAALAESARCGSVESERRRALEADRDRAADRAAVLATHAGRLRAFQGAGRAARGPGGRVRGRRGRAGRSGPRALHVRRGVGAGGLRAPFAAPAARARGEGACGVAGPARGARGGHWAARRWARGSRGAYSITYRCGKLIRVVAWQNGRMGGRYHGGNIRGPAECGSELELGT